MMPRCAASILETVLVREPEHSPQASRQRSSKIDCGKAHFEALGVEFGVATNIHEILNKEN